MIKIIPATDLVLHLSSFEVDGTTVSDTLFTGGRLNYPGRKEMEFQLGFEEPYDLVLESRTIEGLPKKAAAAIRYLAAISTEARRGFDLTLDLLWLSHKSFADKGTNGPSLDRLVAALVCIEDFRTNGLNIHPDSVTVLDAAEAMLSTFHKIGLPLNQQGLEEIFDGADPACVGLGLVEL